jgi:hypothetical protein
LLPLLECAAFSAGTAAKWEVGTEYDEGGCLSKEGGSFSNEVNCVSNEDGCVSNEVGRLSNKVRWTILQVGRLLNGCR